MSQPQIQFSAIEEALPALTQPFSVLIDASDEEWTDSSNVKRLTRQLLEAGCRYFVCYGTGAETVHDLIDDVIVEHQYDGITTTFHEDESKEDVAEFFGNVAIRGMKDSLVLVRDVPGWNVFFCDRRK